jgi:hypothetical protein
MPASRVMQCHECGMTTKGELTFRRLLRCSSAGYRLVELQGMVTHSAAIAQLFVKNKQGVMRQAGHH